jgi:hypothetical protein
MLEYYELSDKGKTTLALSGLCLVSRKMGIIVEDGSIYLSFKLVLPELYMQKPKKTYDDDFWWDPDDYESRKTALREAIRLCEKAIAYEEA